MAVAVTVNQCPVRQSRCHSANSAHVLLANCLAVLAVTTPRDAIAGMIAPEEVKRLRRGIRKAANQLRSRRGDNHQP